MRPDRDAHLIVITEPVRDSIDVDIYVDAVLQNLRARARKLTIASRVPLTGRYSTARRVEAHATLQNMDIVYLYGVFIVDGRGYVLVNFSTEAAYSSLRPEFRALIDSFRVSS